MRRVLARCAIAAVLATPAVAAAGQPGSDPLGAKAKGGPFSVRFTVDTRGGRPVAVRRFRFFNLPIQCDQGDFLLSSRVEGQMPVSERRFRGTATVADPPSEARIRGRFVTRRKVRGRVRAEGAYEGPSGTVTGCEGARRFVAT